MKNGCMNTRSERRTIDKTYEQAHADRPIERNILQERKKQPNRMNKRTSKTRKNQNEKQTKKKL